MRKFKVGDRVRIVHHDYLNNMSEMKKYAGRIATVTRVRYEGVGFYGKSCRIDIDKGVWSWYFDLLVAAGNKEVF